MLKRITSSRPFQVIGAYGTAQGGNYAAGLAFNAFQAMFPLILGMLSIVGLAVHDPGTEKTLYDGIVSVFPQDAQNDILQALEGVKHNAGILGIVAIVGLLWSGTSFFASMEFALTRIFDTKQRDMLRQRLMGLVMLIVFLLALLLTVTANSAAAANPGAGVLGVVVGAVILVALMTAIYRFVPNRTFALREIWPGALLAGVLIEVFSGVFPLYAKLSKGFGTYGQQFALFFLLATWLSFLSQFILVGAVFNKMRLGTPRDEGIVASSAAESRPQRDPAEAIEDEKRKAAGDNGHAGNVDGTTAARNGPDALRSVHTTVPVGGGREVGPVAERPRAASAESRAALEVWVAAALVGAVASRLRRR